MSWTEASEFVGCPVPTIDWHTRTGRIATRPFKGARPTLKRESVEEFAVWWAQRQAERSERRARPRVRMSDPPDAIGWLDTSQAAARLGVSRGHVPWLAERGVINGVRSGQRWWLDEESVEVCRLQREAEREEWLSHVEAAEVVGCSPQTVLIAAKSGRIDQRHMPRGFPSLSRASVETFAAEQQQRAREREQGAAQRPVSGPPDDHHTWLGSAETAQILGISRRRVDQLAKQESLPFVQVGRRRWFRRDHVDLVKHARRASKAWSA
jgi:excisionase family DNA binding protein